MIGNVVCYIIAVSLNSMIRLLIEMIFETIELVSFFVFVLMCFQFKCKFLSLLMINRGLRFIKLYASYFYKTLFER